MKQIDRFDLVALGTVRALPIFVAAVLLLMLVRLSGCAIGFRVESMIQ